MSTEKILEVTNTLALTQALNPMERDQVGFSNAHFPTGFVLSSMNRVMEASALLWLYPRQTEEMGITREMLQENLPEGFTRDAAYAMLQQFRDEMTGVLAFTETNSGVLVNGIRLSSQVLSTLRGMGATRTNEGWQVPANRIQTLHDTLGSQMLRSEELLPLIRVPQLSGGLKQNRSNTISFQLDGNKLGWTYVRNDTFNTIKEVVKAAGGRYDGSSMWDLNPLALQVVAISIVDLALEGVDVTALLPLAEAATQEAKDLRDEISTNSMTLKPTVDGDKVKLNLRKYDQEFISACKSANGKYDGAGGWTVPVSELPAIVSQLSQFPRFDFSKLDSLLPTGEEIKAKVKAQTALPTITHTPTGLVMFAHQVEDVAFFLRPATEAKGKLLANDMGLGKTLSAIVAADKMGAGKILIVVPAVAKLNWEKEIRRWIGPSETVQILKGRSSALDPDARWTIVNYDIISFYKEAMMEANYDVAVLDECHNFKTYSAKRTGALIATWDKSTRKMIPGILTVIPHVWAMSGTPILNRPKELFTILRAIGHRLGQSKSKFEQRYCDGHMEFVYGRGEVWVANGASNLGELAKVMASIYRRLMKENVLNLPPKMRQDIEVELSAQEERAYENLVRELEQIVEMERGDGTGAVLRAITAMKIHTAKVKIPYTIEEAESIIESGNKVIIFTEYTDVLKKIVEHFGTRAVYIDGSVSGNKREAAVEAFQNDPSILVLVGNIKAAGVAITLTAASYVIFNDKPWTPALIAQAEDRSYRIGQTKMVNVLFMVAAGTFDVNLSETLHGKEQVISSFETMSDEESKNFQVASELKGFLSYLDNRKKVSA